jgi:hypothetical protein
MYGVIKKRNPKLVHYSRNKMFLGDNFIFSESPIRDFLKLFGISKLDLLEDEKNLKKIVFENIGNIKYLGNKNSQEYFISKIVNTIFSKDNVMNLSDFIIKPPTDFLKTENDMRLRLPNGSKYRRVIFQNECFSSGEIVEMEELSFTRKNKYGNLENEIFFNKKNENEKFDFLYLEKYGFIDLNKSGFEMKSRLEMSGNEWVDYLERREIAIRKLPLTHIFRAGNSSPLICATFLQNHNLSLSYLDKGIRIGKKKITLYSIANEELLDPSENVLVADYFFSNELKKYILTHIGQLEKPENFMAMNNRQTTIEQRKNIIKKFFFEPYYSSQNWNEDVLTSHSKLFTVDNLGDILMNGNLKKEKIKSEIPYKIENRKLEFDYNGHTFSYPFFIDREESIKKVCDYITEL